MKDIELMHYLLGPGKLLEIDGMDKMDGMDKLERRRQIDKA
jgi:hypothetical protein